MPPNADETRAETRDETRGDRTRRAILDAAIARFGRDGYRATAVTAVARDAGIGATAPYLYFPTKEALFFAAADDDIAGVIEEIFGGATVALHDPAWPGSVMAAAMTSLEGHPLAWRILAGQEPDAAARVLETPALAEAHKLLAADVTDGQRAGSVRTDISPDDLAGGLIGILLALLAAGLRFGLGGGGTGLEAVMATMHASVVPGR